MKFHSARILRFSLVLLLVTSGFAAQTAAKDQSLRPPRKDLITLHWPDLSQLEAGVREQISSAQSDLAVAVGNSSRTVKEWSEAYGQMGQLYHAYSLYAPARDCYRNANLLTPGDFRWIYLLGTLDRQEGRFDQAISRYQAALKLEPGYVAALVNLGNIFLEQNRLDEAGKAYRAAVDLDANNAAAHYGLGQVAMSQRNYAEAVARFQTTLTLLPGANRVHYSLAMAYRGLGNSTMVAEHLAEQGPVGVRTKDPLVDGLQEMIAGERLLFARANIALEAKRYADAAAELRKIVDLKPDNVTARINLGATLMQLGDQQGAAEQFQEALRIEPEKVNAHYNLAVLLAGQGKHEQAIDHLEAVLRVAPKDLNARFLLASELLKVGRKDDALAEYTQVAQADPNNESAALEQVKLLYGRGDVKQSLALIKKAYEQYPRRGRTIILLTYLLTTADDPNLRDGSKALELAQLLYDATGTVRQGALVTLALAELGRCDEAAAWQKRMVGAAEQQANTDLVSKLTAMVKLYEQMQSCKPASDPTLSELSFYELQP